MSVESMSRAELPLSTPDYYKFYKGLKGNTKCFGREQHFSVLLIKDASVENEIKKAH